MVLRYRMRSSRSNERSLPVLIFDVMVRTTINSSPLFLEHSLSSSKLSARHLANDLQRLEVEIHVYENSHLRLLLLLKQSDSSQRTILTLCWYLLANCLAISRSSTILWMNSELSRIFKAILPDVLLQTMRRSWLTHWDVKDKSYFANTWSYDDWY